MGVDMLQTSARLLRLLTLLQTRRFWSGRELGERLEVTERTVRRDVEKLRSLGYPVDATSGVAGGYQLGAGASVPPLLLEDDEALAVALGLRSTAAGTVTGMEEASVRALTKLEQVLPARLKRRVKAFHATVVPLHLQGPPIDPDVLATLATACRDAQLVELAYEDRSARATRRVIEPHGVVHTGARWYLVAWDRTREDWRTFRVDRIRPPIGRAGYFTQRKLPERDLATYVSRSISSTMYCHQARFLMHAPLEVVAQRISPLAGKLEAVDDGSCILETGGPVLDRLPLYVASFGVDFQVIEPPELVASVRELATRLLRAAEGTRAPDELGPRESGERQAREGGRRRARGAAAKGIS